MTPQAERAGGYSISAAARATGLTTYTIRMWERRYRAVVPARTSGKGRVFSQRDVDRLARLRRLTEVGHAIRLLAPLPDAELDQLARSAAQQGMDAGLGAGTGAEIVAQFLDALDALDASGAEAILARAAVTAGPRAFVTAIAAPILEQVGERWEQRRLPIFQEHLASGLLRIALGKLLAALPVHALAPTAVAGTLTGEEHLLGALFAALFATLEGWRVILLDTHAPAAELHAAAVRTGARAILVSFIGPSRTETRRALARLVALTPPSIRLLAGGRTAPAYAKAHAALRVTSLAELGPALRALR